MTTITHNITLKNCATWNDNVAALAQVFEHDWAVTKIDDWFFVEDTATTWWAKVEDLDALAEAGFFEDLDKMDNSSAKYQAICDRLDGYRDDDVPAEVLAAGLEVQDADHVSCGW